VSIHFTDNAWADFGYWLAQDSKTIKKINQLLVELNRGGRPGKAEILRGRLSGYRSVRIDEQNRLIYKLSEGVVEVYSCRGHYSK